MRTTRRLMVLAVTLTSLMAGCAERAPAPVAAGAGAQGDTTGKVTLESTSIALGVGVSWGDGTLEYRGRAYKFSIKGLNLLDLGVSKVTARGEVSKLNKLEDFSGNYVAAAAGAVVGGGAGAAAMRNQNGVELVVTATAQGVRFAIPAGGVDIKLAQ
jgi:hypothetical protein